MFPTWLKSVVSVISQLILWNCKVLNNVSDLINWLFSVDTKLFQDFDTFVYVFSFFKCQTAMVAFGFYLGCGHQQLTKIKEVYQIAMDKLLGSLKTSLFHKNQFFERNLRIFFKINYFSSKSTPSLNIKAALF